MTTVVARGTISASDIIDAAALVLAERGYAGTTLDRVAERFGITRQGVLHYFASKQDLFRAVLERDREWAAEKSQRAPRPDGAPPLAALSVFVDTSGEAMQRLRLLHVLRGEAIAGDAVAARFIRDRSAVIRSNVRSTVEETEHTRGLRGGWSIETATDAVIAIIDGLQTAALIGSEIDPVPVFSLFINAIAAPPLEGTPRAD